MPHVPDRNGVPLIEARKQARADAARRAAAQDLDTVPEVEPELATDHPDLRERKQQLKRAVGRGMQLTEDEAAERWWKPRGSLRTTGAALISLSILCALSQAVTPALAGAGHEWADDNALGHIANLLDRAGAPSIAWGVWMISGVLCCCAGSIVNEMRTARERSP